MLLSMAVLYLLVKGILERSSRRLSQCVSPTSKGHVMIMSVRSSCSKRRLYSNALSLVKLPT